MNWSWWYLVLLIPLAMIILIVMASCKRPSQISINWGWVIGLLTIGLIGWGIWWFINRPKTAPTTPNQTTETSATHKEVVYTKALVLRFDGLTPCSPTFNYTFELDTQGDPISLKFPSVRDSVLYSGKGTIEVPKWRTSGPVHITSQVPNKQVRVRIWEVILIRR